ncbi:phosphomannomutase [uncultured Desulfovibrio sp.]|uniref:phosphomannomutase n=1 Tax=uncultured Desulfovibrio sp. TaxID=167968 RepID=UPI002634B497|nr:phosphomannomutase [uncultured Desulfovibrio sp.]
MSELDCFKAYDVRGAVPEALSPQLVRSTGRAFAAVTGARHAVIGRDARLSGPLLRDALCLGLRESGCAVTDIGMCGTEEIYHAAFAQSFDGGIMITGSHNPAHENGLKMVRAGAVPISGDSGLHAIRDRAAEELRTLTDDAPPAGELAPLHTASYRTAYVEHLLRMVGTDGLRPLKIHCDAGNGCAGLVLRELAPHLPYVFTFSNVEPDGHFPHGVPNPLLPEKREATARAVKEHDADMGLAWDGDFDRCFFYDHEGTFIEGYYLVGLLAEAVLENHPGGKIVHDPRLLWNTQEVVTAAGGKPVLSKAGHAFMKETMRAVDAVYGGEMSAHHFFREFAYCDSGMLPWLMVARIICRSGKSLKELVAARMAAFPCSGEINRSVRDAAAVMDAVYRDYAPQALEESRLDGLSLSFKDWRFNLRPSNTEPLLRLNVEARGDAALMMRMTKALLHHIDVANHA